MWKPETEINNNPRDIRTQLYGLTRYGDLFTPRQLVALTTFSDLVQEVIEKCRQDALTAGMAVDQTGLDAGGCGVTAYAHAVGMYMALMMDRVADYNSTLCTWHVGGPTTGTKS